MGKKKEPDINDAVKYFSEVIERLNLVEIYHINNVVIGITKDNYKVLIPVELDLWNKILDMPEDFKIPELDVSNELNSFITYTDDLYNDYYDIDTDSLYAGDIIEIKIKDLPYPVNISKKLLPIKLRKNEFNNFQYRVTVDTNMVFIFKKLFDYPVEGCKFHIIVIFKII